MSHKDGIKLSSGKIISGKDLPYLAPDEIKELIESPSTQWDYLVLRDLFHGIRNDMQGVVNNSDKIEINLVKKLEEIESKIANRFDNIDHEFTMEVGNGRKIRRKLSSIVAELYDDHYAIRLRRRKFAQLKDNKSLIIIFLLAMFGVSIFFHDQVNALFHMMETEIELMIGAGLLIPALIAILRWILSKKRN